MEEKLLSVIMPSYNRKEFVCSAIDSVLNQSYKNVEIIVVDDCSTDGSFDMLTEKYSTNDKLILHRNEHNSGAGFNRKLGYSMAHGDYIVFMDDDDYYTNMDFYRHAVDILEQMPNVGLVSSSSVIEYVQDNRFEEDWMNIEGLINNAEYLSEFQQKYMKSNSSFTTVFRRKALEDANFSEMEMVNDASIYMRALLAGDCYVLKEISGNYRVHTKNITFNLKTEFIIDNLVEKKRIHDEIIKRNLLQDTDTWLKKQMLLTVKYFIINNNIGDEDMNKLTSWISNNCGNVAEEINNELWEIYRSK